MCLSTAVSRTPALRTNPTQPFAAAMPAMRSPTSADAERAAPVDDEHPAVARAFDLLPQEHVVVEAADGRDRPAELRHPAELPQLQPADERVGVLVGEIGGRGHRGRICTSGQVRERHGERDACGNIVTLWSRRGSPSGRLPEVLRERRPACGGAPVDRSFVFGHKRPDRGDGGSDVALGDGACGATSAPSARGARAAPSCRRRRP